MMMKKKSSGCDEMVAAGKTVIVAVKACGEIPKSALMWALTHVVQPGDWVKFLVIPSQSSSNKMRVLARFAADCATGHHHRSVSGMGFDHKDELASLCSQMMHELQDVYDPDKVKVRLKIVSKEPCGAVVAEAKKTQSNWVILEKRLKHEKKSCLEELQCNLVVMDGLKAKVLRLNLIGSSNPCATKFLRLPCDEWDSSPEEGTTRGPLVTPASSPDHESPVTMTDVGTSSISSSEPELKVVESESSDTDRKCLVLTSTSWMDDVFSPKPDDKAPSFNYEALFNEISKLDREINERMDVRLHTDISLSIREAVSLLKNGPLSPPPLCSVCRHKAPVFGNPPRWFSYAELELATDGFSRENFLAEGGYGSVHHGTLLDGQVVAVKQHKSASSQGDIEFCAEVEVLSCAQHRNLVTLIGFCVEGGRRLLVYEYICNGSLDLHLYGNVGDPLVWASRQKIAMGAARGLRYLHEECRVGCIIHRDLRPNNILLTHDFEPLVGDFGLARWQPDGQLGVDTRVIGTFGYLDPEYAQSGQITDKADIYSFGVVLVELVTGRKAMDINRPKGQQCLTEWARPLLGKCTVSEMIDPNLKGCYSERELRMMLRCASLCIRRDPKQRPRISQVIPAYDPFLPAIIISVWPSIVNLNLMCPTRCCECWRGTLRFCKGRVQISPYQPYFKVFGTCPPIVQRRISPGKGLEIQDFPGMFMVFSFLSPEYIMNHDESLGP